MHCLIQGATIIDAQSPFHLKQVDIRILNGVIDEIGEQLIARDAQVIPMHGKYVSPGWMDMMAAFGDPGHEYRETMHTGCAAAAAGGFTAVGLLPDTQPAIHSKAEVEYIIHSAAKFPVRVFPYGAVTQERSGKELTEIYDMYASGAIAFTDAPLPVKDAGIMLRSLQYVKPFSGVIINITNDHRIVGNANVNEGEMSVSLGMYGIPDVLEELMVIRDIKLAEYAGSQVHIGAISSARVLPHIRDAKKRGIQVTVGVAAYQLFYDETVLADYNAHYKVNPPLRTVSDRNALREAVLDGTIDVICSFHQPHENDAKDVEFEYAAFGMASLETAFGAACAAIPDMNATIWVEKAAVAPRKILNVPMPVIRVGETAEITLFDMDTTYTCTKEQLVSRSSNNPFPGETLKGKVYGIINKSTIKLNNHGK